MDLAATYILIIFSFLTFIVLAAFACLSLREGAHRAAQIALTLAIVISVSLFLFSQFSLTMKLMILGIMAVGVIIAAILFTLPIGQVERVNDVPISRFDERDVMFARANLIPGSREFEGYYAMRPENRVIDDRFRALPGLLSPDATKADPLIFASAKASFALTKAMREEAEGPVAEVREEITEIQSTYMVKRLARFYGAVSVGITELHPYHIYSHIGRGTG